MRILEDSLVNRIHTHNINPWILWCCTNALELCTMSKSQTLEWKFIPLYREYDFQDFLEPDDEIEVAITMQTSLSRPGISWLNYEETKGEFELLRHFSLGKLLKRFELGTRKLVLDHKLDIQVIRAPYDTTFRTKDNQ